MGKKKKGNKNAPKEAGDVHEPAPQTQGQKQEQEQPPATIGQADKPAQEVDTRGQGFPPPAWGKAPAKPAEQQAQKDAADSPAQEVDASKDFPPPAWGKGPAKPSSPGEHKDDDSSNKAVEDFPALSSAQGAAKPSAPAPEQPQTEQGEEHALSGKPPAQRKKKKNKKKQGKQGQLEGEAQEAQVEEGKEKKPQRDKGKAKVEEGEQASEEGKGKQPAGQAQADYPALAPRSSAPTPSSSSASASSSSSSSSSSSRKKGKVPAQAPACEPISPQALRTLISSERKTVLTTNMFGLNEDSVTKIAIKVHRYEIDVNESSQKPSANLVRSLVFAIRRQDLFKNVALFSDGSKILFALEDIAKIVSKAAGGKNVEVLLKEEVLVGQTALNPKARLVAEGAKQGVLIDVIHRNRLYKGLLRKAEWNSNDVHQKAQMLQVAIKYCYYEHLRKAIFRGGSIFSPDNHKRLGQSDLVLFEGVFQSVRFNGYSQPILNVDLSYMVAFCHLSVLDYIKELAWIKSDTPVAEQGRIIAKAFADRMWVNRLNERLADKLVVARYGNEATYRLSGIRMEAPHKITFPYKANKNDPEKVITMTDHMRIRYKLEVSLLDIFVLVAKMQAPKLPKMEGESSSSKSKSSPKPSSSSSSSSPSRATYLVPSMFSFVVGQRQSTMSTQERTSMIAETKKYPKERFVEINKQVKQIAANLSTQNVNIGIGNAIELRDVRVLVPKPITYRGSQEITPVGGEWQIDVRKFYGTLRGPVLWALVHSKSYNVESFCTYFPRRCRALGLDLADPEVLETNQTQPTFADVIKSREAKTGTKISFYLCFLPKRGAPANLYESIKSIACIQLDVVTQCIIDEDKKGQPKVLDAAVQVNLAISINAKLGAENCFVQEKAMKDILQRDPNDVIVMGLDVFHGDTKNPEQSPSVVALCASKTSHFNSYITAQRTQHARQELTVVEKSDDPERNQYQSDTLSPLLQEVFKARLTFPSTVVFYRDGVGEGMYERVVDFEIRSLQATLSDIYKKQHLPAPRLTYMVVQKRNHLRSACGDSRDGNPPPGTLVDAAMVVDNGQPNFYLYSHRALAGTARPTHYQLLLDENNFHKDQLAYFTYALTHLHQGCTKSVSIPAPVFYADLACGIAGTCFRNSVSQVGPRIRETLYMI